MTPSTSAVAVCCARASPGSVIRGPFSIAMTAGGQQRAHPGPTFRAETLPQSLSQRFGQAAYRHGAEKLSIVGLVTAMVDAAEVHRLIQHRVEHRREIAG